MTDRAAESRADHNTLSLRLIEAARRVYASVGDRGSCLAARDAFLHLYQTDVKPHLATEEPLLVEAEDQVETRLLAQALRAQHRALDARAHELADATAGLDAVAAARAVQALFSLHVIQLDDYLLPALRARSQHSHRATTP